MKRQHVERARTRRRNMTDAERALWHRLRSRALGGHRFRRQHDIGPYIADFVCKEAMLVPEIDGGQHGDQQDYDARRTAYLQSQGYRVLRFWNNDVLTDIESVLEVVWEALAGAAPHPGPGSSPGQALSPAGRGSKSQERLTFPACDGCTLCPPGRGQGEGPTSPQTSRGP